MDPFSTPWKHKKTVRFSDAFRGQRKGALGTNGLNIYKGFFFVGKDRYRNAFAEDIPEPTERVRNIKNVADLYGQTNLKKIFPNLLTEKFKKGL